MTILKYGIPPAFMFRDTEVDKVADMEGSMVADMEVNKVADMEVDKVADMVKKASPKGPPARILVAYISSFGSSPRCNVI